MQRAKVLLVDDDVRFIKRVRQFLASETELEIVGEAGDGQEAIVKARELRPDLVLMDIRLPDMNGLEVTRRLKAEIPALTVVILTIFDLQEYREAAVANGASAFVPKRDMQTQLLTRLWTLGFASDKSSEVLSLIKSYRARSHEVVPVRLLASVISRHADGEKGKANWYAGQASKGLSSPIKADFVGPFVGKRIALRPSAGKQTHSKVWESKVTSNVWVANALPTP
jgi:DNA-binding NarL/FixJ family response regulator